MSPSSNTLAKNPPSPGFLPNFASNKRIATNLAPVSASLKFPTFEVKDCMLACIFLKHNIVYLSHQDLLNL